MGVRRVQMDLSERAFERLKSLKEKVDAASYTEVLKDALRLYEYILTKDMEGVKFFIKEPGSSEKTELKLFVDSPAPEEVRHPT
jgi:hypothetical protein